MPDPDRFDLAALRAEYARGGLTEDDLAPDPVVMFRRWYDEATAAGVHEPRVVGQFEFDRHLAGVFEAHARDHRRCAFRARHILEAHFDDGVG